jgi:RNA polymerase sigma-70 factor, ECF subfamily
MKEATTMDKLRGDGTSDTFEAFYEEQFVVTFRAAWAVCGDRGTAEEVTQEAFIRALQRWDRLKHESWKTGWVISTTVNLARRAARRRRRNQGLEYGKGPRPLDETAQNVDVWRAIRSLPRRQQEAVVLHYITDCSVESVATLMKCDTGTVKTHLSRGRRSLQRALEGERHDG